MPEAAGAGPGPARRRGAPRGRRRAAIVVRGHSSLLSPRLPLREAALEDEGLRALDRDPGVAVLLGGAVVEAAPLELVELPQVLRGRVPVVAGDSLELRLRGSGLRLLDLLGRRGR